MESSVRIAVASRSFSKNETLKTELLGAFGNDPDVTISFNDAGLSLSGEELIRFLQNADRAIIALETINDEVLSACPSLRVIGKYGVGLNNIDLDACARHDVRIGWTPGVNRQSVAEMCVALAISVQRRLFESNRRILEGKWGQLSGPQLSSSTVGIIGFGNVGRAFANLLRPFGCTVLVNDLKDFRGDPALGGLEQVTFEELISRADVVSLHVPSTKLTRNLINADAFRLMKPSAILINTARGDVVDNSALKQALGANHIAGAALDVFQPEPPIDNELLQLPNLISTAHLGGSSFEAILAMGRAAIQGLSAHRPALAFVEYQ